MRRSAARIKSRAGPSSLRPVIAHPVLLRPPIVGSTFQPIRNLFGLFKSNTKPPPPSPFPARPDPVPVLSRDNLFHPLAESPFPDIREKAERVRQVSICPVSVERYNERVRPNYDCPDCGWPTHRSRERWEEGREEHLEVCSRLREVTEDEHDLRSGRRMTEFENMPSMSTIFQPA